MKLKKIDQKKPLEKDIESYLCKEIKRLGGTAYKFTSPGRRSVPDRLCVLPGGVIAFIECKAPGKEPTERQYNEINKLKVLGHDVTWVDTKEQVEEVVNRFGKQMHKK